ncbi:hypothetical protein FSARC_8512 [Fusarium sarcochroum]|uniref:Uncharacterized protein n=1 Tax=Fusarium sarcochroum TaxID=1208366 RepID=A0A8H4TSR8_9HYPO|nr:hypothetical protein FSARC_8512 [Fusarium sarcochroum]
METSPETFKITNLFGVSGIVAVVTGGGTDQFLITYQGIGRVITQTLANNGASKVFILGRRLEKLQETAATSPHQNIIPIQADATSKDDLDKAVSLIADQVGYINLLVCNAGASGPHLFGIAENPSLTQVRDFVWENWTPETFTQPNDLHVTSALFSTMAFLDLLDKGNSKGNLPGISSQVIVNASISSFIRSSPGLFAYATSKAGANHLMKVLSTFLSPHKIRVNALNPGNFHTDMTDMAVGKLPTFTPETIPAGRLGSAEDIAGVILFLCSRSGSYVNGLSLVVDGGLLTQAPSTY